MKILVVDDEEIIRELLVEYLSRKNYQDISLAKDGNQAKEKILLKSSGIPFDLVITDTNMPRLGGIELTNWIKNNYPKTYVILMSALHETKGHRADAFIKKPFELKKLDTILDAITPD